MLQKNKVLSSRGICSYSVNSSPHTKKRTSTSLSSDRFGCERMNFSTSNRTDSQVAESSLHRSIPSRNEKYVPSPCEKGEKGEKDKSDSFRTSSLNYSAASVQSSSTDYRPHSTRRRRSWIIHEQERRQNELKRSIRVYFNSRVKDRKLMKTQINRPIKWVTSDKQHSYRQQHSLTNSADGSCSSRDMYETNTSFSRSSSGASFSLDKSTGSLYKPSKNEPLWGTTRRNNRPNDIRGADVKNRSRISSQPAMMREYREKENSERYVHHNKDISSYSGSYVNSRGMRLNADTKERGKKQLHEKVQPRTTGTSRKTIDPFIANSKNKIDLVNLAKTHQRNTERTTSAGNPRSSSSKPTVTKMVKTADGRMADLDEYLSHHPNAHMTHSTPNTLRSTSVSPKISPKPQTRTSGNTNEYKETELINGGSRLPIVSNQPSSTIGTYQLISTVNTNPQSPAVDSNSTSPAVGIMPQVTSINPYQRFPYVATNEQFLNPATNPQFGALGNHPQFRSMSLGQQVQGVGVGSQASFCAGANQMLEPRWYTDGRLCYALPPGVESPEMTTTNQQVKPAQQSTTPSAAAVASTTNSNINNTSTEETMKSDERCSRRRDNKSDEGGMVAGNPYPGAMITTPILYKNGIPMIQVPLTHPLAMTMDSHKQRKHHYRKSGRRTNTTDTDSSDVPRNGKGDRDRKIRSSNKKEKISGSHRRIPESGDNNRERLEHRSDNRERLEHRSDNRERLEHRSDNRERLEHRSDNRERLEHRSDNRERLEHRSDNRERIEHRSDNRERLEHRSSRGPEMPLIEKQHRGRSTRSGIPDEMLMSPNQDVPFEIDDCPIPREADRCAKPFDIDVAIREKERKEASDRNKKYLPVGNFYTPPVNMAQTYRDDASSISRTFEMAEHRSINSFISGLHSEGFRDTSEYAIARDVARKYVHSAPRSHRQMCC